MDSFCSCDRWMETTRGSSTSTVCILCFPQRLHRCRWLLRSSGCNISVVPAQHQETHTMTAKLESEKPAQNITKLCDSWQPNQSTSLHYSTAIFPTLEHFHHFLIFPTPPLHHSLLFQAYGRCDLQIRRTAVPAPSHVKFSVRTCTGVANGGHMSHICHIRIESYWVVHVWVVDLMQSVQSDACGSIRWPARRARWSGHPLCVESEAPKQVASFCPRTCAQN